MPRARPFRAVLLTLVGAMALACSGDAARREPAGEGGPGAGEALQVAVDSLAQAAGAQVGLYYRSLGAGGDSVLIQADTRVHAASTMKVPVLMQLFLDRDRGRLSLEDSLVVDPTFASIVDGSPYTLDPASDSDSTLYARAGESVSLGELASLMITRSSNLATNLLIERVDAQRVTGTLRDIGVDSMDVLRGVEDLPAFEAGLSNTTTARALGRVFLALAPEAPAGAVPEGLTEASRREMLAILERQEFRKKIPAGLPAGVRVANKTGWITAVSHDAALVFPPSAPTYVLVVLTRGLEDPQEAEALIAEISRHVWAYHTGGDAADGA